MAQEFINLKHGNMSVKEFFTKLNALAKYALRVVSINMGKMKVFFWEFKLNIA